MSNRPAKTEKPTAKTTKEKHWRGKMLALNSDTRNTQGKLFIRFKIILS